MNQDLVVTIIPNWNLKNDLGECLNSLLLSIYSPHLVVVVDNGSEDGSIEFIKNNYPNIHLIALPENLGFAGAVNYGIDWAQKQNADYFFVLNNDTIIPPNTISQVVEIMKDNINIGIASPKILQYHKPNHIYSLGTRIYTYFPLPVTIGKNRSDDVKYSKVMNFDYVTGTAMMLSALCVEKTGLFNTNYFMYYEDSEYCRRAQRLGFSIVCVGFSTIYHKGAVSASKNRKNIIRIRARNRFLFYRQYSHGPSRWLTFFFLWVIALWKIFGFILKGNFSLIKPYLSGLWQGYKEPLS